MQYAYQLRKIPVCVANMARDNACFRCKVIIHAVLKGLQMRYVLRKIFCRQSKTATDIKTFRQQMSCMTLLSLSFLLTTRSCSGSANIDGAGEALCTRG